MQFDPARVITTVNGALLTGFAKDSFITITYNSPLWTIQKGSGGFGIFSKTNDLAATTKLVLMSGSIGNLILFGSLVKDTLPVNLGFFPFALIDDSSGSSYTAVRSRIMKIPDRVYSAESQPIEWEIGHLELIPVIGANFDAII